MRDDKGFYTKDGDKYVSITTAIGVLDKPALPYFYAKHGYQKAKQITEEACAIGDYLHLYISNFFLEQDQPKEVKCEQKQYYQAVKNFHRFVDHSKPKPLNIEQTVYWGAFGERCAGTLDAVISVGKKMVLVDWKTSKAIYETYLLQANAYAFLALESKVIKRLPDEVWVVRFDKEKEMDFEKDIFKFSPCNHMFNLFLEIVRVFYGLQDLKEFYKTTKKENKNERN